MTEIERQQQQIVIERLRRYAWRLATTFDLPLRSLDPEGPRVRSRYGICFDDGSIRIRLRSVRTGEILEESALVDTLCHELAHLKHFDHGQRFWVLYKRIREYARRHGIYRPGQPSRWRLPQPERVAPAVRAPHSQDAPARRRPRTRRPPAGPVQLELF